MTSPSIRDIALAGYDERVIAFHPDYARITGSVTAGLLLSQFVYWSKGKTARGRDGWFWKTQSEIIEETSLSRSEQETARKKLIRAGMIEEERRGVPARMWFRVNDGALADALIELRKSRNDQYAGFPQSGLQEDPDEATSMQESCNLQCRNPADSNAGIPQTIQETTQKTTQENTRSDADASPAPEKSNGNPAREIVEAFMAATGNAEPANKGKAYGAAKTLHAAGFTPTQIGAYVQWVRAHRAGKGFDLGTLVAMADSYRNAQPREMAQEAEVYVRAMADAYGARLVKGGLRNLPERTVAEAAFSRVAHTLNPEQVDDMVMWAWQRDRKHPEPQRIPYVTSDWIEAGRPKPVRSNDTKLY